MPFTRDPVTRTSQFPALRAWLERTFQNVDDGFGAVEGRLLQLERLQTINGIRVRYAWDTDLDTQGIPAPSGFVKGNSASAGTITEFSISRIDVLGRLALLTGIFDRPREDGFIQIENYTRDTRWSFDVTGTVTGRATDVLVPVANIVAIGAPAQQDDAIELTYYPEGFVP